MSRQLTTSRTSRNRRLVAMSVWLGLIITAMVLWNSRTQQLPISSPSEPVAFLLAAFTTFVSLFAWMLFNPARGVSAETTTLTLAGAATLFPPCIVAFCTMPPESPLSGWLTLGLFILLVIAVMSPVPEEFFGIPRDRHSYVRQVSMAGLGDQSVLDLHPDWLQSTDLTASVPESERPSLAPNSWRDHEQLLPRSERRRRIEPEESQKETPTERRPAQERKGVFRQLRDRAVSLRDAVSHPEEESQSVSQSPRTAPSSKDRSTRPKHTTTDGPASPLSIPVPFDSPDLSPIQIAGCSQQTGFERITDEQGGEMIEGTVTIRFDRGQKRANVHIPFSPPFSGMPEVECVAVDDEFIRIKVPERRSWGLRIEGRRSDTSAVQESEIAFSAVYVPTH